MVVVCTGDRRYGAEVVYDDNILVGVLAGGLQVVQADRTRCCGPGNTVLLPRKPPATLRKYPRAGVAYQGVVMKLATALGRVYCMENAPAPARPAAPGMLLFPTNPLLQSFFAALLPYLGLAYRLPDKL